MAGSVFGIVLVTAVIILLFAFINPLVGLAVLVLAGLPLGWAIVKRGMRHAAPTSGAQDQPSVPSSSDASYEPVRQPGEQS